MRILHCTDLHGDGAKLDWLVSVAGGYDLICLTGDFLDLTDYENVESQIQRTQMLLDRIPVPVAVCSGNNDSLAEDPRLFQAAWLRGIKGRQRWGDGELGTVGGVTFRCIAWNAIIPQNGGDEVWLAHAPPASAPTAINRVDGHDCGDLILGEHCRAGRGPVIVLSGHQHEPVEWACNVGKTWSFNPGVTPQLRAPNSVTIDMDRRIAELLIDGQVCGSVTLPVCDDA